MFHHNTQNLGLHVCVFLFPQTSPRPSGIEPPKVVHRHMLGSLICIGYFHIIMLVCSHLASG